MIMTTQGYSYHRIQSLFPFALASLLVLGIVRLIIDNLKHDQSQFMHTLRPQGSSRQHRIFVNITAEEDGIQDGCNVFEGQWVWDNVSYPLYTEGSCPYLVKQTTCQKNGRPDFFHQNWRWQPHACDLPRFDPLKLLEVLRDKRLMFIRDSIQRGHFESMVCLVQSVIPEGQRSLHRVPPMKIFREEEYNASIEYYWAPFIVESISDHVTNHTVMKRMVTLDSIAKDGKHWEGVDYLVFESYVWWMHRPLINSTYGSLQNVKEYNVTTAYTMKLGGNGWKLASIQIRKKVFFTSMYPTHLWSREWRPGTDDNCHNESHPIQLASFRGTGSNVKIMKILEEVQQGLKVKIASTGVLPGVPDTWNEILNRYLMQNHLNAQKTRGHILL